MNLHNLFLRALLLVIALYDLRAPGQNAGTAGQFMVEHPTLLNLGFDWAITGDAKRIASVEVQYRASRESNWKTALPLLLVGGETVYRRRSAVKMRRCGLAKK